MGCQLHHHLHAHMAVTSDSYLVALFTLQLILGIYSSLSKPAQWKVSMPMARGWNKVSSKLSSNPNPSEFCDLASEDCFLSPTIHGCSSDPVSLKLHTFPQAKFRWCSWELGPLLPLGQSQTSRAGGLGLRWPIHTHCLPQQQLQAAVLLQKTGPGPSAIPSSPAQGVPLEQT